MSRTRQGLGSAFTNVFAANLSSSLGDGISRVAVPLLAARLTDDPLLISGIAALALLPWLFFAIPAGILIDRVDRRYLLAAGSAVRTVLAGLLMVLVGTGSLTIWWLYGVIFVYGAFETVYDGAIRAVVPGVVARGDLHRANARIEASELVVQNFLAAPVTSYLLALATLVPLGLNTAAYAVAGGLALFLPRAAGRAAMGPDAAGPAAPVPLRRQLVEGLRVIWGVRPLRILWLVSSVDGLFFAAAHATLVLFVLDKLAVPEDWFGAFMLVGAVGGLLGSLLVGPLARAVGSGRAMALGSVLSASMLVVMGAFPSVGVAAVAFALTSTGTTVWNVLVMSLRQSAVPSRLLGRVHGTWRTLMWGLMPIGALLGGRLARIDLTTPLLVGGGLALTVSLVWFRFFTSLPEPASLGEEGLLERPPVPEDAPV